jgi:uncharacterized protein
MSRVVHFEILGENPERLSQFYQDAFGWNVNTWGGGAQSYWLVTTGPRETPGIDGGIMERAFTQPVINTIQVESLEETVARIEQAGGQKVHGPNEIPGVGRHAYCTDPEGTMFGVLQPAPASA